MNSLILYHKLNPITRKDSKLPSFEVTLEYRFSEIYTKIL